MLMESCIWFVTAGLSPEDIIPLGDKDSVPENLEGVYMCPVNLCPPNGLIFWFFPQSFVSAFRFSLSVYVFVCVLCVCVCVCVCVRFIMLLLWIWGERGHFFPSPCVTVLIHLGSQFDLMVLLYNLHSLNSFLHCAERCACMNANQ